MKILKKKNQIFKFAFSIVPDKYPICGTFDSIFVLEDGKWLKMDD